jgi:hypothetical protein
VPKARDRPSTGRIGSCFENVAAQAFFSTLEHEILSHHHFITKARARQVAMPWCRDFYSHRRRHSFAALNVSDPLQQTRCRLTGPQYSLTAGSSRPRRRRRPGDQHALQCAKIEHLLFGMYDVYLIRRER